MKIICIGRNYGKHAEELGNENPDSPVVFLKPETALLRNNDTFYIPSFSNEIHHEVELLVRINQTGKGIRQEFAHKYYNEISLGIDFTARDLQNQLKIKSLPWEIAKAFDNSAVVSGTWIPKSALDETNIAFHLIKNGIKVQEGNSRDMLFSIHHLIAYISEFFTLKIGDILFTGTPAGVGKVSSGDSLEGFLGNQSMFNFKIK